MPLIQQILFISQITTFEQPISMFGGIEVVVSVPSLTGQQQYFTVLCNLALADLDFQPVWQLHFVARSSKFVQIREFVNRP